MIPAIFKRNFVSYFRNPTGYIFITVFVLLGGIAAFFQQDFFRRNLANLDTLNEWFPYLLLFFVPAVTMSLWSDEKRSGTDELLFTLPGSDLEIVLGKYLSALGIYAVSLVFAFSYVGVLMWLGSPDMGLMFSTWFGYLLLGAAFLAVGMIGSARSQTPTIGFIMGGLFCASFVFIGKGSLILPASMKGFLESVGIWPHFHNLTSGKVTFSACLYFFSLTLLALLENLRLVSARRLRGGKDPVRFHQWAQMASVLVGLAALYVLVSRTNIQADLTAEKVHSVSKDTRDLISKLPKDRPVFIRAFISPDVPRDYVQTRLVLLDLLHEYESLGGGKITLEINPTEKYTPESKKAREYGILHQKIFSEDDNQVYHVWLGVAFLSGEEEVVLPFFFKGHPVEYELTNAIRSVAQQKRRKVGVLGTDAEVAGGLNLRELQRGKVGTIPPWIIVTELERHYEIVRVSPGRDYPADLNVLLVTLPSSLLQPEMDRLAKYIRSGKPVLLLFDPMPGFNIRLAPSEPKKPSPMAGRQAPQKKGNLQTILKAAGLNFHGNEVVWQSYNPHPEIKIEEQPQILFVSAPVDREANRKSKQQTFNENEIITSGLQEMLFLFSGRLTSKEIPGLDFQPLILTAKKSGTYFHNLSRTLGRETDERYILAARVTGELPGEKEKVNVIAVADADPLSDFFFVIRRRNFKDLKFDNITFLLNCIDSLAGDESIVSLRKKRPEHRPLELIARQTKEYESEKRVKVKEAEEKAAEKLGKANESYKKKKETIENDPNLTPEEKYQKLGEFRTMENIKLNNETEIINEEKKEAIDKAREGMATDIRNIHKRIRVLAIILPPIPAFLLALFVFLHRLRRERQSIPGERRVNR